MKSEKQSVPLSMRNVPCGYG